METGNRVLELEHQDTLNSMNNLASTYLKQGPHKVAEWLEMHVMKTSSLSGLISDSCFGPRLAVRTYSIKTSMVGTWSTSKIFKRKKIENHR